MISIIAVLAFFIPIFIGRPEPSPPQEKPDDVVAPAPARGWLGVSVQDLTSDLAKSMGLKTDDGALVNEVMEKSPANSGGLKEEDVIVEFNGKAIHDANDLVREVRRLNPGTDVSLVVMRGNERKTLQVALGPTPRRQSLRAFTPLPRLRPHPRLWFTHNELGMELQDLNKQLGEYFNAPDGKGVLVTEVETGSSAEKAGFKAGDVITKVGSQSVREMDDIWDEVEEYEEGQSVDVEILRKGSRQSLQLTIEESDYDMWFRGPRSELQWKHGCRCDKDALGNLERDLEIELNRSEPELERLKRELEKLGTEIRDVGRQLREQVLAKIRSVTS